MPAKIPAAHLLKYFVNRTREMGEFERMLINADVRLLCLHGPGGMGKSVLLGKMLQVCNERNINTVYIQWETDRSYNYLDIMRQMRDQTGPDTLFQLFNDKVNFFTNPEYKLRIQVDGGSIGDVHVLDNGEIQQSNVTVHVGHTVEIKHQQLKLDRSDAEAARIPFQITEVFVPCLKALAQNNPLVVVLDGMEKPDASTQAWIWNEFLPLMRDQVVSKLFVILAGREKFVPDPSYFDCSRVLELRPLGPNDVEDYVHRRGVAQCSADFLNLILAGTEGEPLKVGVMLDMFMRYQQQSAGASDGR